VAHPLSQAPLARFAVNRLSRFHRDETGAVLVLTLCLFLLMLMMGGVAIDFMRYERSRTALQNTLDRCTLMAASLDQKLAPQSVVEDCMAKAGMSSDIDKITVTDSFNNREVKSLGTVDTNPFFLHLIGINKFDARALSVANQSITNVEIAMVLDVSGSMQGTKIANLKTAANEFVSTMLRGDTENRVSISLVPYNGQVNLGPELRGQFNATDNPNVANMNCIDLPASVYTASAMSQTLAMPMSGNVDTFTYSDSYANGQMPAGYADVTNSWTQPQPNNRWCPPIAGNVVRPMSNSIGTLQGYINGLTAVGATSINAGVKWGLTLLDPASRGIITQMSAQGLVPAVLRGRPFDYDDPATIKVIIVMTDGKHFAEERLNDGFRTGLSPIWRSGNGRYSRYDPTHIGSNKYWIPESNSWANAAYNGGGTAVQQTWEQVWARQNAAWVAWQLYARARASSFSAQLGQYTTAINQIRTRTQTTDMDAQLQQICTLAKSNRVIVYGIAFEAEADGQTQIANCASSPAHYFNAQGLEITTAFRTIASNLSQLKLTQ
jgi:Flp pilus assembly protein TadG